jgi:hypothetical protein
MKKIENLFEDKAIIRGGIMLYSKENALLFIEACKNNGIQILGIDAFYLSEENIQPSLENSVDFSSSGYMKKEESIYSEAIIFFKDKNEKLFFEIVCMD